MINSRPIKPLTKENILELVDDYTLFRHYIPEIKAPGRVFHSPIRDDPKPSCALWKGAKEWILNDFGRGSMNIFQFIMARDDCSYFDALETINRDFGLNLGTSRPSKAVKPVVRLLPPERRESVLEFKLRGFNEVDAKYWGKITINTLKRFKVLPAELVFFNKKIIYSYRDIDPAYSYEAINNTRKILRPYSKNFKWMSTIKRDFYCGYRELPQTGNILIITKSRKDVMAWYELGYPAISPQSEHIIVSPELMKELEGRFKTIIFNYDNDSVGREKSSLNATKYNKPEWFTPDNYKDTFSLLDSNVKSEIKEYITAEISSKVI